MKSRGQNEVAAQISDWRARCHIGLSRLRRFGYFSVFDVFDEFGLMQRYTKTDRQTVKKYEYESGVKAKDQNTE